ncbi:hypothetical protein C1645_762444, partial [Glomus cerebriforme]
MLNLIVFILILISWVIIFNIAFFQTTFSKVIPEKILSYQKKQTVYPEWNSLLEIQIIECFGVPEDNVSQVSQINVFGM